MKRLRTLALALVVVTLGACAYARDHAYTSGRLLDASTDERLHEGTTSRRAIYTVQIGEIVYTLRGERVGLRTKDITKGLIVGDPLQASVEGEHVYLQTPDGKNTKTDIMKRARSQAP